ncbi:MAG TPA: hypothetical protein VMU04_19475 [Candidatus Acidoferrum sp.]|nr:hypothetical protein [Candidatus Acidoferrum sp.]
MNNALDSLLLLLALIAVVLIGRTVRRRIPEHHLSADSRDAVKLAMGLVATMTALLLGLLVSSAKGTYDTERGEVIQMAAKIAFLDRVLSVYGPETAEARAQFRAVVADGVRRMWPDRLGAPADLSPNAVSGDAAYAAIQQLAPRDDLQRATKAQAIALAQDIGQLRMLLLAQMVPSIPKPLLIAVVCWLVIIFLGFSLLAPPNATTTLALMAAALSVAGAVFLIMELDRPLGGLIRISSEPMTHALNQLAK